MNEAEKRSARLEGDAINAIIRTLGELNLASRLRVMRTVNAWSSAPEGVQR